MVNFRLTAISVGGAALILGAAGWAMFPSPGSVQEHSPSAFVGLTVGASCEDVEAYALAMGLTSEEPDVAPANMVWQVDPGLRDRSIIRVNADSTFADLWIESCGLLNVGTAGDPSALYARLSQLVAERPFQVVGVEYSLEELQQIRLHIEDRFTGAFSGRHLVQISIDPVNNRVEVVFDDVAEFPMNDYPPGSVHLIEGTPFEE